MPILIAVAAAAQPTVPPPLPPLVLDAAAPIITATIAGQPLRLRVDTGITRQIELNASAARRLDLANPERLVGGRPPRRGRIPVQVGKIAIEQQSVGELLVYAGRAIPVTLAWADGDHVGDADGLISPLELPHDEIRLHRRAATGDDRATVLPLRWSGGRGLLGTLAAGRHRIDVLVTPAAAETIATGSAAALLAESQGGVLSGPVRDAVIAHGISRPVRDLHFARPVDVAGIRIDHVPARVFDWTGRTRIPSEAVPSDEIVATARFDGQRGWAKLAIGNDRLEDCASLVWTRLPLAIRLECPALP